MLLPTIYENMEVTVCVVFAGTILSQNSLLVFMQACVFCHTLQSYVKTCMESLCLASTPVVDASRHNASLATADGIVSLVKPKAQSKTMRPGAKC